MSSVIRLVLVVFLTVGGCSKTLAQPPELSIVQMPDQTYYVGGEAVRMRVFAPGEEIVYRWYQGLPGDTYRPVGEGRTVWLEPEAASTYWVRVSNSFGFVDSGPAAVTVSLPDPPIFNTQPTDQTIYLGSSWIATLFASAESQVLRFDWYEGESGDTNRLLRSETLLYPGFDELNVSPTSTTRYWVRVSNAAGSVDSRTVTVRVLVPAERPEIVAQPVDATNYVGSTDSILFSLTAREGVLRWEVYEGTAGETNKLVQTSAWQGAEVASGTLRVAPEATTRYWARVFNAAGYTDSRTVTVFVVMPDPPVIVSQPDDVTIVKGRGFFAMNFRASSQVIREQWYIGNAGDTNTPVSLNEYPGFRPLTNAACWVRVSNAAGWADSRTVAVRVIPLREALEIAWNGDFKKVEAGTTVSRSLRIRHILGYWEGFRLAAINLPPPYSIRSKVDYVYGWDDFIVIDFSPEQTGNYAGVLGLHFDVQPGAEIIQLPISGEGSAPSRLFELSPSLDFNTVQVNRSARREAKLKNTGASAIPLGSLTLPEGFAAAWAETNLAWDQEITIPVSFSPGEARAYSGALQVEVDGIVRTVHLAGLGSPASGKVVVPDDQPSISFGIDAAGYGDVVRVLPGHYRENVLMGNKGVHLQSVYVETGNPEDIQNTVIDGGGAGPVISFSHDGGSSGAVSGFILTNGSWGIYGYAATYDRSESTSLSLSNNVVAGNLSGGIYLNTSASIPFFGRLSGGAGVTAVIKDNQVIGNAGPALLMYGAGDWGNIAGTRYGTVRCEFIGNIVAGNESIVSADSVDYRSLGEVTFNVAGSTFYNNGASPFDLAGVNTRMTLHNSIVWSSEPSALTLRRGAVLRASNSLIGTDGIPLEGVGNIYDDPQFRNAGAGDFSLLETSPCIDAGQFKPPGRVDFSGVAPDMGALEPVSGEPRVFLVRQSHGLEIYFNGVLESSATLPGAFTAVSGAQTPHLPGRSASAMFWRARAR